MRTETVPLKNRRPATRKKATKKSIASKTELITNENFLPALLKLLSKAKKTIDILQFSFAIGSVKGVLATKTAPYKIAEKLAQIKERHGDKIKIRLFIEGHRETADRNRVTANFLKKAGIDVRYGSTHAKGFCIDGRYVLFGSTNLTQQSITKNHETNLLLDDPKAASGFDAYFMHLWKGGKHGGIILDPPMIADGGFKDVLVNLIDTAKMRLEFSIYFFIHTEIEEALIRAHERGVKITGFIHQHNSFGIWYVRRTRDTANRLLQAGISDLHFGPSHLFTHSKFIVKDRKEVMLGTGNWLVEDVKTHPQIYIHLHDAVLAKKLSQHLAQTLKEEKKRGLSAPPLKH